MRSGCIAVFSISYHYSSICCGGAQLLHGLWHAGLGGFSQPPHMLKGIIEVQVVRKQMQVSVVCSNHVQWQL
jgi:hypothetical protein